MKNTLATSLLAAVILICVAVMFVATVDQPHTPNGGLGAWVYDYQALIGGALAVAAAAFTIIQMQASDDANERRHGQLYGLSLRQDYLRVHRAFHDLEKWDRRVRQMVWPDREIERAREAGLTDETVIAVLNHWRRLEDEVGRYSFRFFSVEEVDELAPLFDGEMVEARSAFSEARRRFRQSCQPLDNLCQDISRPDTDDDHPAYGESRRYARKLVDKHPTLKADFDEVIKTAHELNRHMRGVLELYEAGRPIRVR